MAIDTKSLTELITEFRALQAKDAVSSESLGYILQRIVDLLSTAGTSVIAPGASLSEETVTKIQNLLDGFTAAGQALTAIAQGQSDRNHIYADKSIVNLATGAVASSSGIFIQQAITECAGAMRAQQVIDLNTARKGVADLQTQLATLETVLAEMQKALGIGDGSTVTNVVNTAQISCQVVSGQLHILGATKLIAAGYVTYLFRLTRKRNQYHHKPQYRTTADADKRYCSPTKVWHLYGSCHAVKMNGSILTFSTNGRTFLHLPATTYSPLPQALVSAHTRKVGMISFGWGRSNVLLNDAQNAVKTEHRLIRLVAELRARYPHATVHEHSELTCKRAQSQARLSYAECSRQCTSFLNLSGFTATESNFCQKFCQQQASG